MDPYCEARRPTDAPPVPVPVPAGTLTLPNCRTSAAADVGCAPGASDRPSLRFAAGLMTPRRPTAAGPDLGQSQRGSLISARRPADKAPSRTPHPSFLSFLGHPPHALPLRHHPSLPPRRRIGVSAAATVPALLSDRHRRQSSAWHEDVCHAT
ncbi:hypothetical protein FA09DRAFT_328047 [Tilletiopsis washingtonensis]|uniref:Uncharacterized protein n=1 Tax=Tilletiopsis washingtonensis TaxID=58919 RepID=A0A316ZEF8_9BASI|nr:hypothetical protein FA09DRAFT_328047 [Tilletiopsis washingtonensis]PWN99901.1 hypothetical protein FA09DRAFT_328047 [Tilletiopsis washingtonensis]